MGDLDDHAHSPNEESGQDGSNEHLWQSCSTVVLSPSALVTYDLSCLNFSVTHQITAVHYCSKFNNSMYHPQS